MEAYGSPFLKEYAAFDNMDGWDNFADEFGEGINIARV